MKNVPKSVWNALPTPTPREDPHRAMPAIPKRLTRFRAVADVASGRLARVPITTKYVHLNTFDRRVNRWPFQLWTGAFRLR